MEDAILGLDIRPLGSPETETTYLYKQVSWNDDQTYSIKEVKQGAVAGVFTPAEALSLTLDEAVAEMIPVVIGQLRFLESQGESVSDIVGFDIYHKKPGEDDQKVTVHFAMDSALNDKHRYNRFNLSRGPREAMKGDVVRKNLDGFKDGCSCLHPFGPFSEQNKANIEGVLAKFGNAKAFLLCEEAAGNKEPKGRTLVAIGPEDVVVHRPSGYVLSGRKEAGLRSAPDIF